MTDMLLPGRYDVTGDIAHKLQIMANLKPGDSMPPEIGPDMYWGSAISQLCADALAEIRRVRGQLPEGMKHCTIVFKECGKGHGRLTATNWVDNGCMHYEIERLRCVVMSQDVLMMSSDPSFLRNAKAHAALDKIAMDRINARVDMTIPFCNRCRTRHMASVKCLCDMVAENHAKPEASAEPWGSAYAMNKENWA